MKTYPEEEYLPVQAVAPICWQTPVAEELAIEDTA